MDCILKNLLECKMKYNKWIKEKIIIYYLF